MTDIKSLDNLPALCIQNNGQHKVQRRIVAAANRFGKVEITNDLEKVTCYLGRPGKMADFIIPAARHYSPGMHVIIDEIQRLRIKCGEPELVMAYGNDQGFIDQFDNYWTREEAFIIATHSGQINATRDCVIINGELYSENLY